MFGKSVRPLTSCDGECAAANHCRIGGYQCRNCGIWFCPDASGGDSELCGSCLKEVKGAED